MRFSLTGEALENAATSGKTPPMPTGLNDPNYELRRLRQGYFYIYSQKHVGKTTDAGGKWLIFKYTVSSSDSNAPELNQEQEGQYSFTQYEWVDGHARGNWVKSQKRKSFPYPYVNPQTAVIEFAYSEYRWPPELFEKLEADASVRAKIMQRLPLKTLETNFSFLLTEKSLKNKVSDFNLSQSENDHNIESKRRATAVGYSERHKLNIPKACKNGEPIVVAVYDPIGNIKDISAYHTLLFARDADERVKELYPITTARAVKSMERLLRKTSWNGYPIDPKTKVEMEKYLEYRPTEYENKMKNLAYVQAMLLRQTGNYTVFEQLLVLNKLMSNYFSQKSELNSVINYAMGVYISGMANICSKPKGVPEQAKLLELQAIKLNSATELPPNLEQTPKSWGDILTNILTAIDKSNSLLQEGTKYTEFNKLRFDILIGEISAGQLHLWQKTATNALMYNHYMQVFGLRVERMPPTKMKNAVQILRTQLQDFIQGKSSITNIDMPRHLLQLKKKESLTTWFKVNVTEQSKASKLINAQTQRIGLFLASVTLFSNLNKWFEDQSEKDITDHAGTQLIADFCALVAALERKENTIAKDGMKKLFEKATLGLNLPVPKNAAGMGIMRKVFSFETAGRVANVAAIVIAYGDVKRGNASGDKAQKAAGMILIAGEICGLLASFSLISGFIPSLGIIGFAVVLISLVVRLFGDNPYEAWVRTGFWGNSPQYWNKDRLSLLEQNSAAERLTYSETDQQFIEIKKLFDKEMQGYYNLAWGIQITPRGNWNLLEIRSPAFWENDLAVQEIQLKLQIEHKKSIWEYNQFDLSPYSSTPKFTIQGKGTQEGGIILWDISEENPFKRYKQIKVADNNALPDENKDVLTVYVDYPKLGEKTKTFWDKMFAEYFEGSITFEGYY
ncbi:T6SS effector BTH_I2691 family protein [Rodentibacter myodis]|uniref:T6SS effector BTH_I2691 family protein n=1 Tax=Rodentibacter myodis TaxID=1907939 RepID=UPI001FC963ED